MCDKVYDIYIIIIILLFLDLGLNIFIINYDYLKNKKENYLAEVNILFLIFLFTFFIVKKIHAFQVDADTIKNVIGIPIGLGIGGLTRIIWKSRGKLIGDKNE